MLRALDKQPVLRFIKPAPVQESKPVLQGKLPEAIKVAVDSVTKKHIPDSCLSSWPPAFVSSVTVNEIHDILFYVQKDTPNGPAPTNPLRDTMFIPWD